MRYSCAEAAADVYAGLRGELPSDRAESLRSHLAACPACAGEDREARALAGLLGGLPAPAAAPDGFARLRERIEADDTEVPGRPLVRRLLRPAAALAAAAGFVLVVLSLRPTSGDALLATYRQMTATHLGEAWFRGDRTARLTLSPDARLEAEGPSRLFVIQGRVLAVVEAGEGAMVFATPDTEVTVPGTTLLLSVDPEGTTVAVVDGKVDVRTGAEPVRLRLGETVTVSRGAVVRGPEPADLWGMREWCSAPTARLTAEGDLLVLTLVNDTPQPLVVEQFDPARAAYSLRIQGPDGSLPMVVRGPMVRSGARGPGDPLYRTVDPREGYGLTIALDSLDLPPGEHEIRAVYQPYRDLPPDAWRGTRETNPVRIRRP